MPITRLSLRIAESNTFSLMRPSPKSGWSTTSVPGVSGRAWGGRRRQPGAGTGRSSLPTHTTQGQAVEKHCALVSNIHIWLKYSCLPTAHHWRLWQRQMPKRYYYLNEHWHQYDWGLTATTLISSIHICSSGSQPLKTCTQCVKAYLNTQKYMKKEICPVSQRKLNTLLFILSTKMAPKHTAHMIKNKQAKQKPTLNYVWVHNTQKFQINN